MTQLRRAHSFSLQLLATGTYDCSYLPNRTARSLVAAPNQEIDANIYDELIRAGFRRNGLTAYKPHCVTCQECIPSRVVVADFEPNRSQRRALSRHADLIATPLPLSFRDEHFQLYRRYQSARHPGGGMDDDNRDQYENFLLQSGVDTLLIEFRESQHGLLRMVCVIDLLSDGLSSVYTFFDPDLAGASLGTYAILWQIAQCRLAGLGHLYLGYWISGSAKMAYKANFRPLEIFIDYRWQLLEKHSEELG